MKKPPTSPDFARFAAAVSHIVKVSPQELRDRTAAKKQSGKRLSKGASLSPAASEKIKTWFCQNQ